MLNLLFFVYVCFLFHTYTQAKVNASILGGVVLEEVIVYAEYLFDCVVTIYTHSHTLTHTHSHSHTHTI